MIIRDRHWYRRPRHDRQVELEGGKRSMCYMRGTLRRVYFGQVGVFARARKMSTAWRTLLPSGGRFVAPVRGFAPAPASGANLAISTAWPKDLAMLETVAVVLIILWFLGLVSSYTMGGLIHILLVLALIVIIFRVFQGRRV
jgi:hypothetical protein